MAGRQTTGAMRAVTADQYNRERNIMNNAPHYEPVADDYPTFNTLRPNNQSVTDSFFDFDRNKSTFMDAPGPNPFGPQPTQIVETVVTTTAKKPAQPQLVAVEQPVPNAILTGMDPMVPPPGNQQRPFNNPYVVVEETTTTTTSQPVGRGTAPPVVMVGGQSQIPLSTQVPPNFRPISHTVDRTSQIIPGATVDSFIRASAGPAGMPLMVTAPPGGSALMGRNTMPMMSRTFEERNEDLARKLREAEMRNRELDDRLHSLTLERDKIIIDYEDYINKIKFENAQMKGMEGMVRKLEAEKEFLENEIEKVRAIKMMLENQLNAYSESAEINRLRMENERLLNETRRIRTIIYTETGAEGDINRMDIGKAISKYRSEVTMITQQQSGFQKERVDLQRRIIELEDALRFAQNDANNENILIRNQLEASRQQIVTLQQVQADYKRTETERNMMNLNRMNMLEQDNVALKAQLDSMRSMVKGGAGDDMVVQEIQILRQKIREYEAVPQTNMAAMQEAEFLRGQLAIFSDKVQRLEQRNQQLDVMMQNLAANTGGGQNNAPFINEVRQLNERIRASDAQNALMRQQLLEANHRIANQAVQTNMTYIGSQPFNQGRGVMGTTTGPGGMGLGTGGPVGNEFFNLSMGPGGQDLQPQNAATTTVTKTTLINPIPTPASGQIPISGQLGFITESGNPYLIGPGSGSNPPQSITTVRRSIIPGQDPNMIGFGPEQPPSMQRVQFGAPNMIGPQTSFGPDPGFNAPGSTTTLVNRTMIPVQSQPAMSMIPGQPPTHTHTTVTRTLIPDQPPVDPMLQMPRGSNHIVIQEQPQGPPPTHTHTTVTRTLIPDQPPVQQIVQMPRNSNHIIIQGQPQGPPPTHTHTTVTRTLIPDQPIVELNPQRQYPQGSNPAMISDQFYGQPMQPVMPQEPSTHTTTTINKILVPGQPQPQPNISFIATPQEPSTHTTTTINRTMVPGQQPQPQPNISFIAAPQEPSTHTTTTINRTLIPPPQPQPSLIVEIPNEPSTHTTTTINRTLIPNQPPVEPMLQMPRNSNQIILQGQPPTHTNTTVTRTLIPDNPNRIVPQQTVLLQGPPPPSTVTTTTVTRSVLPDQNASFFVNPTDIERPSIDMSSLSFGDEPFERNMTIVQPIGLVSEQPSTHTTVERTVHMIPGPNGQPMPQNPQGMMTQRTQVGQPGQPHFFNPANPSNLNTHEETTITRVVNQPVQQFVQLPGEHIDKTVTINETIVVDPNIRPPISPRVTLMGPDGQPLVFETKHMHVNNPSGFIPGQVGPTVMLQQGNPNHTETVKTTTIIHPSSVDHPQNGIIFEQNQPNHTETTRTTTIIQDGPGGQPQPGMLGVVPLPSTFASQIGPGQSFGVNLGNNQDPNFSSTTQTNYLVGPPGQISELTTANGPSQVSMTLNQNELLPNSGTFTEKTTTIISPQQQNHPTQQQTTTRTEKKITIIEEPGQPAQPPRNQLYGPTHQFYAPGQQLFQFYGGQAPHMIPGSMQRLPPGMILVPAPGQPGVLTLVPSGQPGLQTPPLVHHHQGGVHQFPGMIHEVPTGMILIPVPNQPGMLTMVSLPPPGFESVHPRFDPNIPQDQAIYSQRNSFPPGFELGHPGFDPTLPQNQAFISQRNSVNNNAPQGRRSRTSRDIAFADQQTTQFSAPNTQLGQPGTQFSQTNTQFGQPTSHQHQTTANTFRIYPDPQVNSVTYTNAPMGQTTIGPPSRFNTNIVSTGEGHMQAENDRLKKMDVLLGKKQREVDDLLLRIFLVAAENDRLRNEDQLLQNIKILKNNPLLQRSIQENDRGYSRDQINHNSSVYEMVNKTIPPVNVVGHQETTNITTVTSAPVQQIPPQPATEVQVTRHIEIVESRTTAPARSTPDRISSIRIDTLNSEMKAAHHSEQTAHHEADTEVLLNRMRRNNRDIESVIEEVYEKHGIRETARGQRYNTPTRTEILQKLHIEESEAKLRLPSETLRKTELEEYFKSINNRLMEAESLMHELDRTKAEGALRPSDLSQISAPASTSTPNQPGPAMHPAPPTFPLNSA